MYNFVTDILGLPSGEIITIPNVYIQVLYIYGFILFDPNYNCWTFSDKDIKGVKHVLKTKDLCLF